MPAIGLALLVGLLAAGGAHSQDQQMGGSAPVGTAATNVKAVAARLQRHYQETTSFKAKFKQTIVQAGVPPRVREGTAYYRKPGRIRWDFGEPQPETVVSDGAIIYDYDPGLNQVLETPMKEAVKGQAAAAFLLGVGNLQRDFRVAAPKSAPDDGLVHIKLTPRAGGDGVELGLDPKSYNIEKLRITDSLGNVTAVDFSGIETNLALGSELFAFEVPEGTDIVRPSGQQ